MAQTKKTTKTSRSAAAKEKRPAAPRSGRAVRSKRPTRTAGAASLKSTKQVKKPTAPLRAIRPPKTVFKKKELERFRALLSEEQERLREELEIIEERAARALEIEAASELSDYDDHPADVASETFEREKDLAIRENFASLLARVQNALDKIDKGTYGICDICRQPIRRARLEAIPFATLCIECQGRVEVG